MKKVTIGLIFMALLLAGLALGAFLFSTEVVAESFVRSNPVITMLWTSTDPEPGSGIDGYSTEWSRDTSVTVDEIVPLDYQENEETDTFTLEDGVWYFNIKAKDNAGHWSNNVSYGPVVIDTSAPSITITKNPAIYDGENGWFKSPLHMECTAEEGSAIYYSWDNVDFTLYEGQVQAPEGTKTFYAYAIDEAGNQSVTNEITIKVDTVKPLDPTVTVQ